MRTDARTEEARGKASSVVQVVQQALIAYERRGFSDPVAGQPWRDASWGHIDARASNGRGSAQAQKEL